MILKIKVKDIDEYVLGGVEKIVNSSPVKKRKKH